MLFFLWKRTQHLALIIYLWIFFHSCWEIIKFDILLMFEEFENQNLDLGRLNYGIIALLPKTKEANKIQQYRL